MTINYETTAPGVYVEEITPAGPIAGAGTSVPAFIGVVKQPPPDDQLGQPVPITNWTSFTAVFGDDKGPLHLPIAVRGFYANGGTFGYVVPIKDTGGIGDALASLTRYPDVSLVCVPGVVDPALLGPVISHCEALGDRFAVLDGVQDAELAKQNGALKKQRDVLVGASDNGFGALYWPWIQIADPQAPPDKPATVAVPPSGHIAGVMARCDATVGVHKAPANETVRGALSPDYLLNDAEQGQLNQLNINAIRQFPGGPPLVWGARTLTANTQWRYVNVRRLVCYIEDSLTQGLRWAVFEPNNTALWKGLERTISEFLTRVWEAGALFGATANEAFYVLINDELNPAPVRNLGQVIVEIGLAPTRPAEWVVLRIGLWDGGARITEG